jgi:arylsulfatase A-like enzyme
LFWPLFTEPGHAWHRPGILIEHQYDRSEWKVGVAPSFCAVRTARWMFAHHSGGEEELYNLAADPFELHNLVRADRHVAARLRARTRGMCRPVPPDFRW